MRIRFILFIMVITLLDPFGDLFARDQKKVERQIDQLTLSDLIRSNDSSSEIGFTDRDLKRTSQIDEKSQMQPLGFRNRPEFPFYGVPLSKQRKP